MEVNAYIIASYRGQIPGWNWAWIGYHSRMMPEKKSKRTLLFRMLAPILAGFFNIWICFLGLLWFLLIITQSQPYGLLH